MGRATGKSTSLSVRGILPIPESINLSSYSDDKTINQIAEDCGAALQWSEFWEQPWIDRHKDILIPTCFYFSDSIRFRDVYFDLYQVISSQLTYSYGLNAAREKLWNHQEESKCDSLAVSLSLSERLENGFENGESAFYFLASHFEGRNIKDQSQAPVFTTDLKEKNRDGITAAVINQIVKQEVTLDNLDKVIQEATTDVFDAQSEKVAQLLLMRSLQVDYG